MESMVPRQRNRGYKVSQAGSVLPPRQDHAVPPEQEAVQRDPEALRREGRDRAVLGRSPGYAVQDQVPADQVSQGAPGDRCPLPLPPSTPGPPLHPVSPPSSRIDMILAPGPPLTPKQKKTQKPPFTSPSNQSPRYCPQGVMTSPGFHLFHNQLKSSNI